MNGRHRATRQRSQVSEPRLEYIDTTHEHDALWATALQPRVAHRAKVATHPFVEPFRSRP